MTILKGPKGGKLELASRTQKVSDFKVPPRPQEIPPEMGKAWASMCRNLHDEGLWHDDRLALVSAYLHSVHMYRLACDAIEVHGAFDPATGKPHTAIAASQRASNHAAVIAKALGLTVSASMIQAKGGAEPKTPTASQGGAWAAVGGK